MEHDKESAKRNIDAIKAKLPGFAPEWENFTTICSVSSLRCF
jgi:hypothetical protein